jgi:hypothetical protein
MPQCRFEPIIDPVRVHPWNLGAYGGIPQMAHVGCSGRGGAIPLRPNSSDINLFRYGESVVDLNPQVAHRTFNFLVSQ